jgi:hypothetical protein
MRFITGIVLGIALTIAGAFVHDQRVYQANLTDRPEAATHDGQIVNWDVLAAFICEKIAAGRRAFNALVAP